MQQIDFRVILDNAINSKLVDIKVIPDLDKTWDTQNYVLR